MSTPHQRYGIVHSKHNGKWLSHTYVLIADACLKVVYNFQKTKIPCYIEWFNRDELKLTNYEFIAVGRERRKKHKAEYEKLKRTRLENQWDEQGYNY